MGIAVVVQFDFSIIREGKIDKIVGVKLRLPQSYRGLMAGCEAAS
jgi:hypothetical protein